ncbi:MAG: hypothetical protein B5M52_05845 [Helicobacteraceae bacterium 4484_230]|nr:MAG: hypothetical protein B5M52_05845 [Helicobacteraceae bacterium 4484_230]
MQPIIDILQKNGKIYKKLDEIKPKELGIRNKIRIFRALDMNGYFTAVFAVSQKSRLLMKDVRKFEEIYIKLVHYCDHEFKYRLLLIDAPICSKAEKAFKSAGWKIL